MGIPKFRVALVVIILSTILSIVSVTSTQPYYIIPSSGSIGLVVQPSIAHMSEIRALFVHGGSFNPYPDWELVAQTAQDYGVNVIVGAFMGNQWFRPSLPEAITATHSRGLELHVLHTTLFTSPGPEYSTMRADGTLYEWMCPTKQISRNLLKSQVEELVSNYDIDGFMFDYIRYALSDHCYCSECKAKLEEWLEESIPDSNWPPNPSDFAPGGSRYNEFLEWRIVPITELVRDMRSWMLAVKPDLKFGAAVWTYWPCYNPASRRKGLGQDWNDWIRQGYLDWVSPMLYGTDLNVMADCITNFHQFATGGPEGKAALAPFLTNQYPNVVPPEDFKAQIDTAREYGADGWVIWRYGGPGDSGPEKPDIRDYLSIIDMPQTFSLNNINCDISGTTAIITWTTDLPATSKVEYSTSPLFNATKENYPPENFDYWDIDHIEGTIIEDSTSVTSHSITITDLEEGMPLYFRVQSQDQSGIATSQVYMRTGT